MGTNRLDRHRRSLMRMGFSFGVASLTLKPGFLFAEETRTYPSLDDILPVQYRPPGQCIFTSVAGDGPFYLNDADVRSDIRDGERGQLLRLRFEVVDVDRCAPLPDAVVQIWHSNAFGHYSGYARFDPGEVFEWDGPSSHVPSEGSERFCRGVQVSDSKGKCEFLTVYPGWYTGRTIHVHAKVHFNDSRLITTQLYFPQEVTDRVHMSGIYRDRGISEYNNSNDAGIAQSAGAAGSWLSISREGEELVGSLKIGVLNPYNYVTPPA